MEKYRQFADGGTGVNPFVPAWSNYKLSLPLKILKALVMTPVALCRLALFFLALTWILLGEGLAMVIPVGAIRYPVYRLMVGIGSGLALLILGVFPVGTSLADHRRLKLAPPKSSTSGAFEASRGTLVLATQQGLTDILFLAWQLSPIFVFVAADGTPMEYTLLGAIKRSSNFELPAAPKPGGKQQKQEARSLADIAEKAKNSWAGPVVVFPEGCNSNGSSIMAWKAKTFEGMEAMDKPVGVALASIQYSKTGAYTPHHTVADTKQHLFWLAFQPYHTVQAIWLPASEAAAAVKGKSLPEQWAMLRTVLCRMTKDAVEVEVPAERHMDFVKYWQQSQQKGYTKAAAVPKNVKKKA